MKKGKLKERVGLEHGSRLGEEGDGSGSPHKTRGVKMIYPSKT